MDVSWLRTSRGQTIGSVAWTRPWRSQTARFETDPGTRLTVGKNLSDQVQLVVSQNLRETGLLTWIVEYLPRRNIELRLVVDDENDPSLAFRHALSLGSPPRRLQAAPAREEAQVGAVRFIGELGLPQTELQSRLRVKAGDRFDFYRWQRDRDELERFYADRDYLEARVRPRRIEEVDGTVTLAYQIVRGPRSVLTIEGYDLPGGVIEQMRDTWNRSVFDGFLLDELRTLAREHLGSDGLLQAVVDAEVLDRPGDDQKEIVLRIEAGPRTTDHRIMLQGNERLTSEELQLFLTRQGIDETAWADPEPITRSLVALYQAEGMLDAQVAVGQPEFGVNTATLPVRITEGPTFHMSEVTIEGVEAFSATAVQSLVRPEAGDVYSGVEISDARVRVDQTYRQAGFNEARVTARSAVDRDSETVSVVLDVNEGPRQIVEEVEIVGRDRSNEKLVSSALQVSPGQPVDLGAWNRARKRLYDTGAFRNVDIAAEPMDQSAADVKPGEQPVRARVLLEEWPAYRLRYGLQLKNEESPLAEQVTREVNVGLVGDLTRQNFVGRAITLGTAFRWDTNDRVLRGFVRTPSFLGLPITSNVFVAQQHEVIGEISGISELQDLTRLTLEQRFQPRSNFTVAYSYNFDRSHDFTETPVPGAPIQLKRFSDSPCTAWARRGTSACTNAGGPMQAYSMDLRERALLDSDAGMKAADVAVKYRVSGSWVRLLKQRRRETGDVAPRVQRHGRRRMLEPHLHTLAALIAEQPDRTVAELKDALGTPASLATIWRAVAALDVTVKKNGPARRTRST